MHFRYFHPRFALHDLHVLKALTRAVIKIRERCIVFQHSGHHLEIVDASGERIRERLEYENRKRLGISDLALHWSTFAAGLAESARLSASGGIGEHIDDQIQDGVAADIVQRRTEHYRKQTPFLERQPQTLLEVLQRQRALLEEFLHQLVVALRNHLDQRFMRLFSRGSHIFGDFSCLGAAISVRRVNQRLHAEQIHHTSKLFFGAYW